MSSDNTQLHRTVDLGGLVVGTLCRILAMGAGGGHVFAFMFPTVFKWFGLVISFFGTAAEKTLKW